MVYSPVRLSRTTGAFLTVVAPITSSAALATGVAGTETILIKMQVPANNCIVGDTFRVGFTGYSSSTGTLIARVRAGANGTTGDTACYTSATTAAQVANNHARHEILVTVRTLGAPGTVIADGGGTAATAVWPALIGATAVPSLTTTAAWWITLTLTASVGLFNVTTALIEQI